MTTRNRSYHHEPPLCLPFAQQESSSTRAYLALSSEGVSSSPAFALRDIESNKKHQSQSRQSKRAFVDGDNVCPQSKMRTSEDRSKGLSLKEGSSQQLSRSLGDIALERPVSLDQDRGISSIESLLKAPGETMPFFDQAGAAVQKLSRRRNEKSRIGNWCAGKNISEVCDELEMPLETTATANLTAVATDIKEVVCLAATNGSDPYSHVRSQNDALQSTIGLRRTRLPEGGISLQIIEGVNTSRQRSSKETPPLYSLPSQAAEKIVRQSAESNSPVGPFDRMSTTSTTYSSPSTPKQSADYVSGVKSYPTPCRSASSDPSNNEPQIEQTIFDSRRNEGRQTFAANLTPSAPSDPYDVSLSARILSGPNGSSHNESRSSESVKQSKKRNFGANISAEYCPTLAELERRSRQHSAEAISSAFCAHRAPCPLSDSSVPKVFRPLSIVTLLSAAWASIANRCFHRRSDAAGRPDCHSRIEGRSFVPLRWPLHFQYDSDDRKQHDATSTAAIVSSRRSSSGSSSSSFRRLLRCGGGGSVFSSDEFEVVGGDSSSRRLRERSGHEDSSEARFQFRSYAAGILEPILRVSACAMATSIGLKVFLEGLHFWFVSISLCLLRLLLCNVLDAIMACLGDTYSSHPIRIRLQEAWDAAVSLNSYEPLMGVWRMITSFLTIDFDLQLFDSPESSYSHDIHPETTAASPADRSDNVATAPSQVEADKTASKNGVARGSKG